MTRWGRTPPGLHGRDLVVRGEVAEGVQHRHQHGHGKRERHRVGEREDQELPDHLPRQALAGEVLQPLGHGVQEEEARERGDGEEKRAHVGPDQV